MATNSSVTITVSPISSVPLMAIRDRKPQPPERAVPDPFADHTYEAIERAREAGASGEDALRRRPPLTTIPSPSKDLDRPTST